MNIVWAPKVIVFNASNQSISFLDYDLQPFPTNF